MCKHEPVKSMASTNDASACGIVNNNFCKSCNCASRQQWHLAVHCTARVCGYVKSTIC